MSGMAGEMTEMNKEQRRKGRTDNDIETDRRSFLAEFLTAKPNQTPAGIKSFHLYLCQEPKKTLTFP